MDFNNGHWHECTQSIVIIICKLNHVRFFEVISNALLKILTVTTTKRTIHMLNHQYEFYWFLKIATSSMYFRFQWDSNVSFAHNIIVECQLCPAIWVSTKFKQITSLQNWWFQYTLKVHIKFHFLSLQNQLVFYINQNITYKRWII